MLAFLLATAVLAPVNAASVSAAPPSGGKPHSACALTKDFVGTAPSDIIQQKFEGHYEQPLSRVDCRDNGLCYQTWGKDCPQAAH